jgi:hypothetical protein
MGDEMKQQTLAVNGFEAYLKTAGKSKLLLHMDKLMPGPELRSDQSFLSEGWKRPLLS